MESEDTQAAEVEASAESEATTGEVQVETQAPAAPEPKPATQEAQTVPYDRFAKVIEERRAAKERADALEKRLAEYDTKLSAAEQARIDAMRRAKVYRTGVTDEDLVDLALYKYGQVQPGEDGEAPEFDQWLPTYIEGKPFFQTGKTEATRDPVRTANKGASNVAPDAEPTLEEIQAMSRREFERYMARKSGTK